MEETQTIQKCKICGENLNEEDYIFMGYCEKCYNKYVDSKVAKYNQIENPKIEKVEKEKMQIPIPLKIICFLFPIVGFIIYICNWQKNKEYANSCGMTSLLGLITPIIIVVIMALSGGAIFNNAKNNVPTSNSSISSTEVKMFNSKFEDYEGKIKGYNVKTLIQAIRDSNLANYDSTIKINVNGKEYTTYTYIDTYSKYNVSFNKDKNGKINQANIVEE